MERRCHGDTSCAMKHNAVFEGLEMLENSSNLAHILEVVKVFIWCGSPAWVWQIGSIAPPTKFQQSSTRGMFHRIHQIIFSFGQCNLKTFAMKSCANHCRSLNGMGMWRRQISMYRHETIYRLHTLLNSSYRIHRSTSILGSAI